MKIHFLREKTYIIYANEKKYLINPDFGEAKTPLPVGIKDILKEVVCVILTNNFELNQNTENRIKQKNISILKENNIDDKDVLAAIKYFNSLDYNPTNGEILLKEKLS